MVSHNILITGGAGFIGSHFVKLVCEEKNFEKIIVLDRLTYAGDLKRIQNYIENKSVIFVEEDIAKIACVSRLLEEHTITHLINFAAETHVDRSIESADAFIHTNVLGVHHLLIAAKNYQDKTHTLKKFLHVSTDEVFGSLEPQDPKTTEKTAYAPRNPYSASKAGGDHFVQSFHKTYGLPTNITYASNNFGTWQFPEKLIPNIIWRALHQKPIHIYGNGKQIRDWLAVHDHCTALLTVLKDAPVGDCFNISTHNAWQNLDLVQLILNLFDEHQGLKVGTSAARIEHITDRLGHDQRYDLSAEKLIRTLNWKYEENVFEKQLRELVAWYCANQNWLAEKAKTI